jgi:hypothetical protein
MGSVTRTTRTQRTRPASSRGAPPLLLFVAASLALHGAASIALRALHRSEAATDLAFDPSTKALTGDTLEVEPVTATAPDDDEAMPAQSPSPAPPSAPRSAPAPAANHGVGAPAAPTGGPAVAEHPALFGAVGVRFASDLATTFTRAFPQAASADPLWSEASFGATSSAEVTLVLDDEGHLERTIVSGSPSAALRRGIERTLALLGTGRAFTAHGAVTRVRLTSRVTRDDVHDGLHGDVFALSGGSFSGDVGNAFFALPPASGPGRRVDVELRLLP